MKGKIAFVLGAAVGYVLGTRAGRERYEQIKRGAQAVWNTETVQRGVGAVTGAAQSKIDDLKASALRAGKETLMTFARTSSEPHPRSEASEKTTRPVSSATTTPAPHKQPGTTA